MVLRNNTCRSERDNASLQICRVGESRRVVGHLSVQLAHDLRTTEGIEIYPAPKVFQHGVLSICKSPVCTAPNSNTGDHIGIK